MIIYRLQNIITKNFYIGCTDNLQLRINAHFNSLKSNTHTSKLMCEDFNKHGIESFIYGIVKESDNGFMHESELIYMLKPQYNKLHKRYSKKSATNNDYLNKVYQSLKSNSKYSISMDKLSL